MAELRIRSARRLNGNDEITVLNGPRVLDELDLNVAARRMSADARWLVKLIMMT